MGGGGGDQDDRLARQHAAIAMDDQAGLELEAFDGLRLDRGQLALGHAGIVLEGHGADRGLAAGLARELADQADEAREAADIGPAGGQAGQLGAEIEGLRLDPDHRRPLSRR